MGGIRSWIVAGTVFALAFGASATGAATEAAADAAVEKAEEAGREAERIRKLEAAEARKQAEFARQKELRRLAIEREKSCLIKPVMTDAEVTHCKKVWGQPAPEMTP